MQFNELFTTDMTDGSQEEYISSVAEGFYTVFRVTCYSDAEGTNPVSATGGTILVTASDDGYNYGSISEGTVDITDEDYDRPYMTGYMNSFRITLSGVTGVVSIRVVAITSKG